MFFFVSKFGKCFQIWLQKLFGDKIGATFRLTRVEIRTGFPPGFFFVSKTCHDALSTKNRDKVSVSGFVTVVTV